MNGQYLEGIEACQKAIIKSPDFLVPYLTIAASYSSLEKYENARKTVTEILRIDPKFSIEIMAMYAPFERKTDIENLREAMRKAGLPEHSPKE